MNIFYYIGVPFQYVLWFFGFITSNSYAIAIILFTVAVNLLLSPLTIKQQKSMAQQARIRPKLEALKEKYGDDKMKMSQAQQDLYQSENVSPTGGCLPMLIRMVILFGVYGAINVFANPAIAGGDVLIKGFTFDFNLFGLDLKATPDLGSGFDWIWLIPILSGVASMLGMIINQAQQKKINPAAQQSGAMNIVMMLFFPIFSIYIAFRLPAAVGYYWIISNIVNTLLQYVVNYLYSANKLQAVDTADEIMKRRKYEAARISSSKE